MALTSQQFISDNCIANNALWRDLGVHALALGELIIYRVWPLMAALFESELQDTHAKNSKGSLALNP